MAPKSAAIKQKWQKMCAGKTSEMLISKSSVFEEPKFRVDGNYKEYIRATFEERRNIIRNSSRQEIRIEKEHRCQAHYTAEKLIRNDLQLLTNFEIVPIADKAPSIYAVLAKRALTTQGRREQENEKNSAGFISQTFLESYLPGHKVKENKIRLMNNLTFNLENVIPVFSELPNETVDTVSIPDNLLFDYTEINFVNKCTEIKLAKAIEMSHERENTIQCNCSSEENVVPCYENASCPCYVLNKKMQDRQGKMGKPFTTKFRSFDPVLFNKNEDSFGWHFGYACSNLCGCKGNCTNNVTMIIDKNIFPLEVFRNNEKMGFSVRSPVMIPAGTPIVEFTGEIVGESLDHSSTDYAFQIAYEDDEDIRQIVNDMPFTNDYKELLESFFSRKIYIDLKNHANVGRFFCHSCNANMEVVRIFQKSLSPAHVRLIFISLLDIYPGTPLTCDYGANYIEQHLNGKCECASFVCPNGKDYNKFNKLSCDEFVRCFQHLDNIEHSQWDKEVYIPVSERKRQEKKAAAQIELRKKEEAEGCIYLD